MSISGRLAAVTAALLLSASVASASVTYDLARDWTTSNPNGAWAYLQGSIALPYWDYVGPLGGPAFAPGPSVGDFLPLYWQSNGPDAPELPVWALLLVGFGGVALGLRHRRGRAARCHLVNDI